tara:strand:- start:314 stop:997 length:684 start_codon:yes stop_codon:yes gene_type:complete
MSALVGLCVLSISPSLVAPDGLRPSSWLVVARTGQFSRPVVGPPELLAVPVSTPSLFKGLGRYCTDHPGYATLAVTSIAALSGDLIAQGVAGAPWSAARMLRFWAVRCLFAAPIYGVWLRFLERLTSRVPKGAGRTTTQVALDALVYTPIYQLIFFALMAFIEGRSPIVSMRGALKLMPATIPASWKFWIPAQIVTFAVLPLQFRVAWVHGLGLLWNAVMSTFAAAS